MHERSNELIRVLDTDMRIGGTYAKQAAAGEEQSGMAKTRELLKADASGDEGSSTVSTYATNAA